MWGSISPAAKSRTVDWTSLFSSLSERSITSTHRHGNRLNGVVAHALRVPWHVKLLDIAVGIWRAAADDMLAGPCLQDETPAAPGKVAGGVGELGLRPDATDTNLHACDLRLAPPRPTFDWD